MNTIKYLCGLCLFFLLFYFESFYIGSISISQIWKLPLVVFLIDFFIRRREEKHNYVFWGFLFAFIQLLNADIFTNLPVAVTRFAKFADLPLLTYFVCTQGYSKEGIWNFTLTVAQYFILSTIPFLLGILHDVVSTENFDFGNFNSRTYYFQSMHAAAIILSFSIIVIAYHIKKKCASQFGQVYNAFLLVVGVYAVYASFARTGMVMSIIGLVVLFFPSELRLRDLLISLLGLFFIVFFFYYQYEHNSDFVNRLMDNNTSGAFDAKRLGSGRFMFLENGLNLYKNGTFDSQMFGYGAIAVQEYMKQKTGMYIGLHNGFADAFVMNGFIGFLFFMKMLIAYVTFILKRKGSEEFRLLIAFFLAFFSCQFTQGNIGFGMDLFTALIVAFAL